MCTSTFCLANLVRNMFFPSKIFKQKGDNSIQQSPRYYFQVFLSSFHIVESIRSSCFLECIFFETFYFVNSFYAVFNMHLLCNSFAVVVIYITLRVIIFLPNCMLLRQTHSKHFKNIFLLNSLTRFTQKAVTELKSFCSQTYSTIRKGDKNI